MQVPGEHKTVQARILKYAQEIGCTFVLRDEALWARKASFYFGDSLLPKPSALLNHREGYL